jgi:hypothetical protein
LRGKTASFFVEVAIQPISRTTGPTLPRPQGIDRIAEALWMQKFPPKIVEKISRGILKNLKESGFDLHTEVDRLS